MLWYETLSERQTVVYLDPELSIVAFWNNSLTTNWYTVSEDGDWYCYDCTTMAEEGDVDDAIRDAHERIAYQRAQEEDENV